MPSPTKPVATNDAPSATPPSLELVFDVLPEELDARRSLAIALAYVETLTRIGSEETGDDVPFVMTLTKIGRDSTDYCWGLAHRATASSVAEDYRQLEHAAEKLPLLMRHTESAPRHVRPALLQLRDGVGALSESVHIGVKYGPKTWSLTDLSRHDDAQLYRTGDTMRAVVAKAGGKKPRVQLFVDGKLVSFMASREVASLAGKHLYQEVEVDADLTREDRRPDFPIVAGRIIRMTPIDTGDAVEAWDKWYRDSGRPWQGVSDEREPMNDDQ